MHRKFKLIVIVTDLKDNPDEIFYTFKVTT